MNRLWFYHNEIVTLNKMWWFYFVPSYFIEREVLKSEYVIVIRVHGLVMVFVLKSLSQGVSLNQYKVTSYHSDDMIHIFDIKTVMSLTCRQGLEVGYENIEIPFYVFFNNRYRRKILNRERKKEIWTEGTLVRVLVSIKNIIKDMSYYVFNFIDRVFCY